MAWLKRLYWGSLIVLVFLSLFRFATEKKWVRLMVENKTQDDFRDLSLDYGRGELQWPLFGAGYTYGEYVEVAGDQPMILSRTRPSGQRTTEKLSRELSLQDQGTAVWVKLLPEDRIEILHRTDGIYRRDPAWLLPLLWLLGLLALGSAAFVGRRLLPRASDALSRFGRIIANPALREAKAELGLVKKECRVRMFTLEPENPAQWWEGTLGAHMIGIIHDRLWVGNPDECTLYALGRKTASEPFTARNFSGWEKFPLEGDPRLEEALNKLSPSIYSVGLLAEAVEGSVRFDQATGKSVVEDFKVLASIVDLIEEHTPPLIRALERGDAGTALELIRAGADPHKETIGRLNALTAAAAKGKVEVVKALLERGAKPMPEYGFPLHAAAGAGHKDCVEALLDAGVPVDAKGPLEATALIMAAGGGHPSVIDCLLERGASVKAKDMDGRTALSTAKMAGQMEVEEILRAAGAEK